MAGTLGSVAANTGKSLVQLKQLFFDRSAVQKAADRAKVRVLSKLGAYVRRAAQTSMRRRKKGSSQPGQPPFAKSGEMRDLLFFSYDPASKSVVVGPLGFKSKGGQTVPQLHEYGGEQTIMDGPRDRRKPRLCRYPARPFMAPALAKTLPKFAEAFRGSISR